MRRGARCIAQSFSMSDSKTCMKQKRVQKLVSADATESCSKFLHGSSYWTSRPVTVKICTRKDMQRTCPPKMCVCPPQPLPKTKAQIFFTTVVFIVKSVIVVTLLYWMYTDGTLPFFPDIDKIDIPRLENVRYSFVQKYNHAVIKIMDVVVEAPRKAHQKLMGIFGTQEKTTEVEEDSEEISDLESD